MALCYESVLCRWFCWFFRWLSVRQRRRSDHVYWVVLWFAVETRSMVIMEALRIPISITDLVLVLVGVLVMLGPRAMGTDSIWRMVLVQTSSERAL